MVITMLKKLTRLLSHNEVHSQPEARTHDLASRILTNLEKNKSRLLIKVNDQPQLFQSIVLSSNRLNNILIMDELFPQNDIVLSKKAVLCCELHEKGEVTSFAAEFIKKTEYHGTSALLMSYPSSINCTQRRNNYRLPLKSGQLISAKLNADFQPLLSGIVKDISLHGLRINIQGNESNSLKKGDVIKRCRIELDNKQLVECQLTVRSKQNFSRPYRFTQVGTEITDIQLVDSNLLSKYVTQQQREQCKARAIHLL